MAPNSLMMTNARLIVESRTNWLSTVVLPLPRKPVSTEIGISDWSPERRRLTVESCRARVSDQDGRMRALKAFSHRRAGLRRSDRPVLRQGAPQYGGECRYKISIRKKARGELSLSTGDASDIATI